MQPTWLTLQIILIGAFWGDLSLSLGPQCDPVAGAAPVPLHHDRHAALCQDRRESQRFAFHTLLDSNTTHASTLKPGLDMFPTCLLKAVVCAYWILLFPRDVLSFRFNYWQLEGAWAVFPERMNSMCILYDTFVLCTVFLSTSVKQALIYSH